MVSGAAGVAARSREDDFALVIHHDDGRARTGLRGLENLLGRLGFRVQDHRFVLAVHPERAGRDLAALAVATALLVQDADLHEHLTNVPTSHGGDGEGGLKTAPGWSRPEGRAGWWFAAAGAGPGWWCPPAAGRRHCALAASTHAH